MAGRVIMLIIMLCCFLWELSDAISTCGGPCRNLVDCYGQLICINGNCDDDPDVGTHLCPTTPPQKPSPPPPPPPVNSGTCPRSGTVICKGISYPTYTCSPPVTSSTPATLTNKDFASSDEPSECDARYYSNSELIVALSTGWYDHGSRCGKFVRITARNGRSVNAKVVDECDSVYGCDAEHAWQPPCRNNIVDASDAVWDALGLNVDVGEEPVTWTMALLNSTI